MGAITTQQVANTGSTYKVELDVRLGRAGVPVGKLVYVKDGHREFSQFAYQEEWLANPVAFDISPDLSRILGYQLRKAPSTEESCFFLALADTEPDSWGRRVIARAHAKDRKLKPALRALTEADYLCAVDDVSRMNTLALGKFPSVNDERSVTRGEVLALRLAKQAGIETAYARVVMVRGAPVAIIRRFDRTSNQGRIPYMSGATLLQSGRYEEHAYTEIVDAMRSKCGDFGASAQALWRRLVFNFLITNVDDHLQNMGFLYVDKNQWQLAPAFDLNPFPDKDRESKTWLSEDTGPITSIAQLMGQAARFQLEPHEAADVLAEVVKAVKRWRDVALTADVGLSQAELEDFAPAFEHAGLDEAIALVV